MPSCAPITSPGLSVTPVIAPEKIRISGDDIEGLTIRMAVHRYDRTPGQGARHAAAFGLNAGSTVGTVMPGGPSCATARAVPHANRQSDSAPARHVVAT